MNHLAMFHLASLLLLAFAFTADQPKESGGHAHLRGAHAERRGMALVASARLTPASDELGQLGTLLVMGLAAAEGHLGPGHGAGGRQAHGNFRQ